MATTTDKLPVGGDEGLLPRRGRLRQTGLLRARGRLRQAGPVAILLVVSICIGAAAPTFWSWSNLMNIVGASAVPLIVGVGMTFVLVSGSIDLSVEGVMGLSAVVVAQLVRNEVNHNDFGWGSIAISLAVGLVVGSLSGLIHARWRLPSFMVTLGVWYAAQGLGYELASGYPPVISDNNVRSIATAKIDTVPVIFLVALGVLAIGYFLQSYTRLGRYAFAIGGDERIAAAAGIPIARYKVLVFALAGACSALAGCLITLRLGTGEVSIGSGELFTVVSAVIVGGTAITGGVGGVLQTLVGVLLITVLTNGMVLLGVNPLLQTGIQGAVLLLAVALTLDRTKIPLIK